MIKPRLTTRFAPTEVRTFFRHVIFGLLPIMLVMPAYAKTEIFAQPHNSQKIPFSLTERGYEADELLALDTPVRVRLDRTPTKISIRAVYEGAVGDEGPWINVPHTRRTEEWRSLPLRQEFDVTIDSNVTTSKVQWPRQFDCTHSDVASTPDQCKRWEELYKSCQQHTENSICYAYQSEIELEVFYKQDATPEIIRIHFPGGC